MFRGRKIRLLPTKEQELLFWKSAGTARWAYNYFLAENEAAYRAYLKRGKTGPRRISADDVRKHINNNLKKTTHQWLKEVSNNVMKMAVKKADYAVKKFLKGLAGKPKFKTKHRTKPSFYVNYASLARKMVAFMVKGSDSFGQQSLCRASQKASATAIHGFLLMASTGI